VSSGEIWDHHRGGVVPIGRALLTRKSAMRPGARPALKKGGLSQNGERRVEKKARGGRCYHHTRSNGRIISGMAKRPKETSIRKRGKKSDKPF